MTPTPVPLIVRLRNWVGDVVLSVATLQRLEDAGFALRLVGKGWARDLLAGHGWPVEPLAGRTRERIAQLRQLAQAARRDDPRFARSPVQAVAFPYSFSSALEMRLAGLRAAGHATEGRRWLLARSTPRPPGAHELAVYWHLADLVTGTSAPWPERIPLRLAPAHHEAAETLCRTHGLGDGFIVLCPFAGGTFAGADKTWPEFADFARDDLPALGLRQVLCPGPGEAEEARARYPQAVVLEGVGLGTYGALLQRARLMISNDTGPGHLAAAVGAPLLSVLGPTDARQWGAWGPGVHTVQGQPAPGPWPPRDAVRARAAELLS